jgi:hypothetical protein
MTTVTNTQGSRLTLILIEVQTPFKRTFKVTLLTVRRRGSGQSSGMYSLGPTTGDVRACCSQAGPYHRMRRMRSDAMAEISVHRTAGRTRRCMNSVGSFDRGALTGAVGAVAVDGHGPLRLEGHSLGILPLSATLSVPGVSCSVHLIRS